MRKLALSALLAILALPGCADLLGLDGFEPALSSGGSISSSSSSASSGGSGGSGGAGGSTGGSGGAAGGMGGVGGGEGGAGACETACPLILGVFAEELAVGATDLYYRVGDTTVNVVDKATGAPKNNTGATFVQVRGLAASDGQVYFLGATIAQPTAYVWTIADVGPPGSMVAATNGSDLACDADNFYWSADDPDTDGGLWQSPIMSPAGTNRSQLPNSKGVAINTGSVYVTDGSILRRIDKGATSENEITESPIVELVASDQRVFWIANGSIVRNTAVLSSTQTVLVNGGATHLALFPDGAKLCFHTMLDNSLRCADANGDTFSPEHLVDTDGPVNDLAIDQGFVYWRDAGGIKRINRPND